MVSGKPLLPPPAAITPITTATKEQEEDNNDKDEFHNFLREHDRVNSYFDMYVPSNNSPTLGIYALGEAGYPTPI